jgi:hypothetical protein
MTAVVGARPQPVSRPVPALRCFTAREWMTSLAGSVNLKWPVVTARRPGPGCKRVRFGRRETVASLCDDVWAADEVLADQVDYYRRRAGEHDVTAYGDVAAARARIARLIAEMLPETGAHQSLRTHRAIQRPPASRLTGERSRPPDRCNCPACSLVPMRARARTVRDPRMRDDFRGRRASYLRHAVSWDACWTRKGCLMEVTNLGEADGLPPVDWPQLPRSSMRGRRQLRTRRTPARPGCPPSTRTAARM